MRIDRVTYRELRTSSCSYNNRAVGAEAALEEGETAEHALEQLRAWVGEQFGDLNVEQRANSLRIELSETEHLLGIRLNALSAAKQQYASLRQVLALHGIEIPESPEHDAVTPF